MSRNGIDRAFNVNNVLVFKTAHHLNDRIGFPDVREKLISQALAFRRAANESGDVEKLDRRRHDLLRLHQSRERFQTLVRNRNHTDVRFDRRERIICRQRGRLRRERVE